MEKSIKTVYIAIYNFVNVEKFFVKNTNPKTAVIVSLKSLSPYSFKFKKKYKQMKYTIIRVLMDKKYDIMFVNIF